MSRLICPRCGDATAPVLATFQATMTIRSSGSYRHENGTATAMTDEGDGYPAFGILSCQSCHKYFVAEKHLAGIWNSVYPLSCRPVSDDIPQPMKGHLAEANLCFAVGANIGCVLLCRTVLIDIQRQQEVSNLKDLMEKGTISIMLFRQADEVRLWANMLAHDDVDKTDFENSDVEQLLAFVVSIIDAVYVQPAHLAKLASKRSVINKDKPDIS
jgi:hypothetical protein